MHPTITSLFMGTLLSFAHFFAYSQENPTLNSFHQQMSATGIVGYQALVVKEGKIHYHTSQGLLNIENPEKINDSSVFIIASLAKPIIAIGILKLVEEGLLNLDESIQPYLPFPIANPNFPAVAITPRMLLTHTSSIQDNWEVLGQLYSPNSPIKGELHLEPFLRKYFLESGSYYDSQNFHPSKPGTLHEYSNVGYQVLGFLIECITRKRLKDYCQESIFDPLGMKNTFWFRMYIPHQNIASPHRLVDGKAHSFLHYGYPSYPEGQIRTSVSDYVKLILMILHEGKIRGEPFLSPGIIREMLKIQSPEQSESQAIAWNYNEFGSEDFYKNVPHLPAHTGLEAGATTAVIFDPEKKSAVLIFNNTQPNGFDGLLSAMSLLAHYAGISH